MSLLRACAIGFATAEIAAKYRANEQKATDAFSESLLLHRGNNMKLHAVAFLQLLLLAQHLGCGSPTPAVDLAPMPPKIGKTESHEVFLSFTGNSWQVWMHEHGQDAAAGISAVAGPIGPVVAVSPVIGEWMFSKAVEKDGSKDKSVNVGTARWPSVVYAGRILTTESLYQDFENQHGADFDLQLVKLPVSWFPARSEGEDFSELLESIEVTISFDDSSLEHPIVQDVFPKTSFEEEGWKVNGNIGVGIGGFVKEQVVEAKADASLGYSFEYTPLVAKVISEGIGNQATWRIREVKDRQPIGQIDYYCIVLVPKEVRRAVATISLTLGFDDGDQKLVTLPSSEITVDFGRDAE